MDISSEWFPLIAVDGIELPAQIRLGIDSPGPADCFLSAPDVVVLEMEHKLYRARSVTCNQNG